MARVVVRMTAEGRAFIHAHGVRITRDVTKAVERDASRRVPLDTGELRESIWSWSEGLHGRVLVGTDHWQPTEYGSGPHIIVSHGNYPLRNRETGQVFGRVVHHPGTPEQPFMRPAAYRRRVIR